MKNLARIAIIAVAALFITSGTADAQWGQPAGGYGGNQQFNGADIQAEISSLIANLTPQERTEMNYYLQQYRQLTGNPNATPEELVMYIIQEQARMMQSQMGQNQMMQNPMMQQGPVAPQYGPMSGGQMMGNPMSAGWGGGSPYAQNPYGAMGFGANPMGSTHQERMQQIQNFGQQNTMNWQATQAANDAQHQAFLETIRN